MKKYKEFCDFEAEFLGYLKKNGMVDCHIFDEVVSCYSFFENKLISDIADGIDELICKMSDSREIAPEIRVFCLQEETVNAFCFCTNQHYYIGIHSATYVELIRRTERLADYLVQNGWGYYNGKRAGEVQGILWTYAFKMILVHEYMHIILGHCDTICSERAFLWEVDACKEKNDLTILSKRELRAMELFADEFAAKDAAWQILAGAKDVEQIKYELLNYYLGVLLVFSIFYNYGNEDESHPKLGIRLHSMIVAIDDALSKELDALGKEVQIEEIDVVIDTYMEIIQQFSGLFSYDIVTALGTEEFDREYVELYNAAADVVKLTNQRAIYPIDEFEKVDENIVEVLDVEREVLMYASQIGMSYDEACQQIEELKKKDI